MNLIVGGLDNHIHQVLTQNEILLIYKLYEKDR